MRRATGTSWKPGTWPTGLRAACLSLLAIGLVGLCGCAVAAGAAAGAGAGYVAGNEASDDD